jgi:hypothetical protein
VAGTDIEVLSPRMFLLSDLGIRTLSSIEMAPSGFLLTYILREIL